MNSRHRGDPIGESEENRSHSHPQSVTNSAHNSRLQQDHPNQTNIRHTHGLQRAELLEILKREQVKRLSCNCRSDNETQGNRDSEIDRNARRTQEVVDCPPEKAILRQCH